MDSKTFLIYGLQRSGTNWLEYLVEENFPEVQRENIAYARSLPVHKHFRPYDEMYYVPEPKYLNNFSYPHFSDFDQHVQRIIGREPHAYLVITKEPYSWYISYCNLAKKTGWKSYMKKWINNHYLVDYSLFCRKWLAFAKEAPEKVLMLRYEDFLANFQQELQKIADHFGLRVPAGGFQNLKKVPMSKKFTESRKTYYMEKQFLDRFSDEELLVINENLDRQVVEELGYELVDWRR